MLLSAGSPFSPSWLPAVSDKVETQRVDCMLCSCVLLELEKLSSLNAASELKITLLRCCFFVSNTIRLGCFTPSKQAAYRSCSETTSLSALSDTHWFSVDT